MGDYQITCINKPDRDSAHDRITHIGNGTWRLALDTAIAMIQAKQHSFYTLTPTNLFSTLPQARADVGVVAGTQGLFGTRPYLRTYADGVWTDNLLALPECNALVRVVTALP